MNRCFSEYSTEDDVLACIAKFQGDTSLMDPMAEGGGYHSMTNTKCTWNQPCEPIIITGP
eukprot:CAMPEP_0184291340 /NCGR_PEP_ID=MMETSP1049-20130417/3392_1 /TAXON_ID=77928 /ORGANISM="Proteomonas sulcata, Strain CCMP704" /LENGTH=59 /DNA_ID=CAMNT_0026598771 /DNA_START=114 /DNA_END=293 /DNA_ORIENTATION=-